MSWVVSAAAYLLCGLLLMESIGKPRSALHWSQPPRAHERLAVVLLWPLLLLLAVLARVR